MRDILTIWVCKLIYQLMRLRGSHGAALPGLIAEKLNPGLLKKLTTLPDGIIVVSGTNGKTTTTHLLSSVLSKMGKKVFTNHSGSNMTRGLLASIVRFSDMRGRLKFDIAVLEIDEAYGAKLAPLLSPRVVILTNVVRDQLDRFGEIDHTAKLLFELAKEATGVVVYNSTDNRLRAIPSIVKDCSLVSYGFAGELEEHFPDDDSLYSKDNRVLPESTDYSLQTATNTVCEIRSPVGHVQLDRSELPGWHNALNLTAVYAVVTELFGAKPPQLFSGLKPPYGRGEVLVVGDCTLTLQLVKNPNSFRSAMNVEPLQPALVAINDGIADGKDVSWLWDVDVQTFRARKSVSTSGTRGYDMAVRLQYEDISCDFIELDLEAALRKFISRNKSGVIFLTYTAMLRSRKMLMSLAGEATK
jgi:UDP-N-acetylmuramyl tripeptide synthase